jgi:hypothetical protein
MPMLSMKTKKPMKPMLAIPEITDEAGLSSPNQPASAPTSRPNHPIHRGSARVVRMVLHVRVFPLTGACPISTSNLLSSGLLFGHADHGQLRN